MRRLSLYLFACLGAASRAVAADLLAGVSEADITPEQPYGLSGYYHERLSTGTRDRLLARTLVLRQGNESVALVECDLCGVSPELTEEVRSRAAGSGIAPERIIIAATHTHTGPEYDQDLRAWLDKRPPGAYPARLIGAVAESIRAASAAAVPLRLSAGSGKQEVPIAFCRRFLMADGKVRTWATYKDPDTRREANPIDPEVAVLLISGQSGARAALVNFALHLDTLGGTRWSADFPHDLGKALQKELGSELVPIFANGCCGDINHVDPRSDARNSTEKIGAALAQTVIRSLPALRDVSPRLGVARSVVRAPLQPISDADLAGARELLATRRSGGKVEFLEEVRAHKLLQLERLRRQGPELPLEVHAIRLGAQAAIVTLPGEVFVELGLAIKKASPFPVTFVVELANSDATIYVPTREAYALGGYEVINSTLAPGGGELLRDAAIQLLAELK